MNSNFSEKQIKAYASAFEEGDAVFVNGNWEKVVKHHDYYLDDYSLAGSRCTYAIKRIGEYGEEPKTEGFAVDAVIDASEQYRVTTLKDYKLKGGEKLVWLGDVEHFTFGKVYEVKHRPEYDVNVFVYDNDGYVRTPKSENWAVIPRYDQIQPTEQKEVEASGIVNTLYKRYYAGIQNMLNDDIQSALEDSDYRKVIKLSKMMMEMQVEHGEEQ